MAERKFGPEIIDRICEGLEEGKSLVVICNQEGMPGRRTVYDWIDGDDELAERLYRARELGYHYRAEMAVASAKRAVDPIAGRLAFDAERWYLGKLSVAFRDKPLMQGAILNVGSEDAFAAFAGALEEARTATARRADSTTHVALPSPSGPDKASRDGVADMAGSCRPRLGQDTDGG